MMAHKPSEAALGFAQAAEMEESDDFSLGHRLWPRHGCQHSMTAAQNRVVPDRPDLAQEFKEFTEQAEGHIDGGR